jgi:hypothetical protein
MKVIEKVCDVSRSMPDLLERISALVEVARCLRTAADELGRLDIKSQIVDEISTLQEIRDTVQDAAGDKGAGGDKAHHDAEPDETETPADSPLEIQADAGIGVVEPTGKEETYSLTPEEEAGAEDAVTQGSDEFEDKSSEPEKTGPNLDDRRTQIEMRIADLEQLEQAATKRMNDVPTVEQRQIKAKAQKAGREAGKSGKELQQYALGAMRLSPEQRSELQAARKDVLSLREAIEKERGSLEGLDAAGS